MQEVTVSDTSEAEYVTLSEAVKGVLLLRQMQNYMEPSMRIGAVGVFEDNERVIKLVVNKHANCRTKHIDMKHHPVRDACEAGKVGVLYVRTEDQRADLFTKPLNMQKFYKHAKTVLHLV
ncbi:unnamed protein product [Ascophyllum nodosum]